MADMSPVLLSICIPTFNRCRLLDDLLSSIQVAGKELGGKFEVVVRDNASPDQTTEIVRKYESRLNLLYSKNEENCGAASNILACTEKATGQYVWIVGDDDLVAATSISTILSHIQSASERGLHAIIVNHGVKFEKDRQELIQKITRGEEIESTRGLLNQEQCDVDTIRFEEIFERSTIGVTLNYLGNVVIQREAWESGAEKYRDYCKRNGELTDAMTSAPHLHTWSDLLAGKQVGLISKPMVFAMIGEQPFLDKWFMIAYVYFLSVSDHLKSKGVGEQHVLAYKRSIYCRLNALGKLILSRDERVNKEFSLKLFMKKYGDDPEMWSSLYSDLQSESKILSKVHIYRKVCLAVLMLPGRWKSSHGFITGGLLNIIRAVSRRVVA